MDDRSPITAKTDFDAIVVGAGFAGMFMLHRLRQQVVDDFQRHPQRRLAFVGVECRRVQKQRVKLSIRQAGRIRA